MQRPEREKDIMRLDLKTNQPTETTSLSTSRGPACRMLSQWVEGRSSCFTHGKEDTELAPILEAKSPAFEPDWMCGVREKGVEGAAPTSSWGDWGDGHASSPYSREKEKPCSGQAGCSEKVGCSAQEIHLRGWQVTWGETHQAVGDGEK